MTYNVFGGTLNPAQSNHSLAAHLWFVQFMANEHETCVRAWHFHLHGLQ